MKRRILAVFLAAAMLFLTIPATTYAANRVGDQIGYVLNTDIRVFIDDVPIMGYNIDGWTYVVAEDLQAYGLDVFWDGQARTLTITNGTPRGQPGYVPENLAPVGSIAFPFVYTDIVTYIYDQRITSYNIQGQTVVRIDDIAEVFGDIYWDGANRRLFVTITESGATNITQQQNEQLFGIATIADPAAGFAFATPQQARPGQQVLLEAQTQQGFEFSHWEIVAGGVTLANANAAQTSFAMPTGHVTVRAVFRQAQVYVRTYDVATSVNNTQWGSVDGARGNLSGGETITLTARPNSGFEFSHWEVLAGGITLANANAAQTSFTMPTTDVSVRAVFREPQAFSVSVTINNPQWGTVLGAESGLRTGQFITLTANPAYGYIFSHWELISGNITLQDTALRLQNFIMPAGDVHLRAVFAQRVGVWPSITLEGNAQFVNNTQAALNLVRRSPTHYAIVLRYIGIIRQHTHSGMSAWQNPPVFLVGHATYTASPTWYASAIVHDAVHSWQYHSHLAMHGHVPHEVWTGMEAEMEALDIQIAFLIAIGAPQHEIDWAESLRGTVWWNETPTW